MKKQLILLASALSIFALIGCNKNNEEYHIVTDSSIKYLTYNGEDKVAMVVGYENDLANEINIPSSINGYRVNAIRHGSFANANISKITIPESIVYIGYRAFAECLNLKTVTLPNSISFIDYNTFAECDSLESIAIPDSVNIIGTGAFLGCDKLKSISLSKNLLSIESYVFANCVSLSSITLPDSLLIIGNYAFNSCTSLDNIFIPASVLSIGEEVFSNNKDTFKLMLGTNQIPSTFNDNFNCYYPYALGTNRNTTTNDVFMNDNEYRYYAINNYQSDTPDASLVDYTGVEKSSTVPETVAFAMGKVAKVTSIADHAFYNNKIETLNLAEATGLKTIGKYALANSSIYSITFNTTIESLGSYSFSGCADLTSIDLSTTNISNIGSGAFYYDYNLTDVKLPNTDKNTKLGTGAFYKCCKLSSITNLDKISNLELNGYTFAECYNLGIDDSKPFNFTSNIKTIYPTDFLDWGITHAQYIKIAKDAYDFKGENVYLTANGGNTIKLEKIDETTYKNNLYFSNATITLEAQ